MHYVGIVQVRGRKDIRPTILVTIIGLLIKDSLVDSDIRIGPTSKVVVSKIGNLDYQKSATKVDMGDGGLTSHFGFIEGVSIECFGISISMDLHVILLKGHPILVLGRPWMQELHIIKYWSIMNLSQSKGFNIFYDLYLKSVIKCIKVKESSINNREQVS